MRSPIRAALAAFALAVAVPALAPSAARAQAPKIAYVDGAVLMDQAPRSSSRARPTRSALSCSA